MPANGKITCPRCGQAVKIMLSGTGNYHIDCGCRQLETPLSLFLAAEILAVNQGRIKAAAESLLLVDYL